MEPRICFIIGSMSLNGGTYAIIQHATFLMDAGFHVTIAIQEPFLNSDMPSWHDRIRDLRCLPLCNARKESYDLVIATWWKTVFDLFSIQSDHYGYFVQSIESKFYPESDSRIRSLVESTYQFPLHYITESTWIKDYLYKKYGHSVTLVKNGIRKDIYNLTGKKNESRKLNSSPRVLIEGPFGIFFKNTALGIRLAREAGVKELWVLTGSPAIWLPKVDRLFSQVPIYKTPEVYRSCDILLKLSTVEGMFGTPLEMFHCGGTAVVFNVTGYDEFITDKVNARVAKLGNVDEVVEILQELIESPSTIEKLKEGAIQTAMMWPSWDSSSSLFMQWVKLVLMTTKKERSLLKEMSETIINDYDLSESMKSHKKRITFNRNTLSSLAKHFPRSMVRTVKTLEAIIEVVTGKRKAY